MRESMPPLDETNKADEKEEKQVWAKALPSAITEEAKQMWVKAATMLDQNDLLGYFKATEELHSFMKQHKLEEKDLRPILKNEQISPKAWKVLEETYDIMSTYSRETSTPEDDKVETSLLSVIRKQSSFFMDCKLEQNERSNPDYAFEVSPLQVVVSIMQRIKEIADPNSEIMGYPTKKVMDFKIEKLKEAGIENPKLSTEQMVDIFSFKNVTLLRIKELYPPASLITTRFHISSVNTDKYTSVKDHLKALKGDALKEAILIDFKKSIDKATNHDELKQIIKDLKGSDEYKTLQTGQGLTTRMLGLTTTSIKAFDKMVEEAEKAIDKDQSAHQAP